MTALNLGLAGDRAIVVCDSLLTVDALPDHAEQTSKCLPFPHLKVVVAFMGLYEVFRCFTERMYTGLPPGTDILDLSGEVSDFLLSTWKACGDQATTILLVGATREHQLAAFKFDSRNTFIPERLVPGLLYLSPSIALEVPMPEVVVEEAQGGPQDPRVQTPVFTPQPWRQLEHGAVAAIVTQKEQGKARIGGPLLRTDINEFGHISQFVLRDLDCDE